MVGFGALVVVATRPDTSVLRTWLVAAALGFAVAGLGLMQWRIVYHDIEVKDATGIVADGPYRGLHTSPRRARDLSEFLAVVHKVERPGDSVIFFNQMPYAYLFSTMRPDTNALWLSLSDDSLPADKNPTMAYYRRTGQTPTVAFIKTKASNNHWIVLPDNPLLKLFSPPAYAEIEDLGAYTVWRKR
jgi:hypothetical protein